MNKGIIFDFDGVIVNSVDGLFGLYEQVLKIFNITIDEPDLQKLNGLNIRQISHHIHDHYHSDAIVDVIEHTYLENLQNFYNDLQPNECVINTIKDLYDCGYILAIASGCPSKIVKNYLENHHLSKYFVKVVGGDEVKKSKPDPEIIKLVMESCDLKKAVLIDDGNSGICSGMAAGCSVIKFDHCVHNNLYFKELILISLENDISYLGFNQNIDLTESGRKQEEYSQKEENKWKNLVLNGAYNDTVYFWSNFSALSQSKISMYEGDYKSYRVKSHDTPVLAVSALILNHNHILMARRGLDQYQNNGELDIVPSGSLSIPEVDQQIYREWHEETGKSLKLELDRGCFLYFDAKANVVDILKLAKYEGSIDGFHSNEVKDFQWLSMQDVLHSNVAASAKFFTLISGHNYELH